MNEFPEDLIKKELVLITPSGKTIEIHLEDGVLILYSNKQWEWIKNKTNRTLV